MPRYPSTKLPLTQKLTTTSSYHERTFIDRIKLRFTAGSGGSGAISFHRDRLTKFGAPNGGDGGKGGNCVLRATKHVGDFNKYSHFHYRGVSGKSGSKNMKHGKPGGDLKFNVPLGTVVWEIEEKNDKQKKNKVCELVQEDQEVIVAKGGIAGKGNGMHRSVKAFHYTNRPQNLGFPGSSHLMYLELKSLAQVGLVGYPNVGKSSFLSSISRALPRIANYEFTTLVPSIGKVKFIDDFEMTVADLPGIIHGASDNKGLGLEFLRHIERCQILCFMIDISREDYIEQLYVLEQELENYGTFEGRRRVLVANKSDCCEQAEEKFSILQQKTNIESYLVSVKLSNGLGPVVLALRNQIKQQEEEDQSKQ